MKKRKKINTFSIVIFSIIAIFSIIIFLSLPVLFNYESLENEIENKFYKEFKINLEIKDKVSYKILPAPHLLIESAMLDLNKNNSKSMLVETNNLKIFIPMQNIFSKFNIRMNYLEIKKANFYFKKKDVKDFRDHMFNRINKPIRIKESNFFYLDEESNVILISPIYSLEYLIDIKNRVKKLQINGNVFDIEYKSSWKKFYNVPVKTFNEIKFKNPNLKIINNFTFKDESNYLGNSLVTYLNENIGITYQFEKDRILIKPSSKLKKQKIKIFSDIGLNPFYFDMQITLVDKNSKFLIDYFLNYLFKSDENFLENLNGKLTLIFDDLDNEIIDSGKINLLFDEKSIVIINSIFKINDVGIINSNFKYYEKENELIFSSSNVLEIKNNVEFARKFQLPFKNTRKISKIFFDLMKNVNNNEISISNIHINKINQDQKDNEFYIIRNIQILKSILRKILI